MTDKVINKETGEVRKVVPGVSFIGKDEDVVTYKVENYIVKTGAGENDFIVKQRLVVASKLNRSDYINSFSGDVGIKNVLKKVALSGKDLTAVVEAGTFTSKQKGLIDISTMPDNIADAYRAVEAGVKAFDQLPPELRKKASFAKFAESITNEEVSEFIKSKQEKPVEKVPTEPKGE